MTLPENSPRITTLMENLNILDSTSIMTFGTEAQADLQRVSKEMLDGVRSKDTGAAGDSIRDMVVALRGFSVSQEDLREKPTFMERIMGRAAPLVRFKEGYAQVRDHIEEIAVQLKRHQETLLKDVKDLDQLYAKSVDFYHNLGAYVEAGEWRLHEVRNQELPEWRDRMERAEEEDKIMIANRIRDLTASADDLERRVHDLKLTRQVTMQSIPSIRLIQENDKTLVQKIGSTLLNTVPLWQTQLAQSLAINNSAKAADAVKGATDLTNELLVSNANNLRTANAEIRTQTERGVFDIEAVKTANAQLIGTLEDSLRIADKAKQDRAKGEAELIKMEVKLRDVLSAKSADPVAEDMRLGA